MATPEETAAAAKAAADAAAKAPKWYTDKADAITIGYIQNRGLHDKTPEEVALATIKSHMEAETFIGAPADQLIRLPKDPADAKAWDAVYSRLGAVKEGEKLDYSAIKRADGSGIDPAVADLASGLALRVHASKDGAVITAQEIQKFIDARAASEAVEGAAKLALEKDALAKNWGANANANMVVAQNAARALGVTHDETNALEKVIGYSKVMEMFRNIGARIGEDKFISGGAGPSPGVMTREQATSKIAELKRDSAWVKRYTDGGPVEHKELMNLQRLLLAPAA